MPAHSPSKNASRKQKRRGEDTGCASQKKQKAGATAQLTSSTSEHVELRHSGRTGAGVGGHLLQLERVGAMIEGQPRTSQPTTTLSNHTAPNPVAPVQTSRRTSKKKHPPPYDSTVPLSGCSQAKEKGTYQRGNTAPTLTFHSQTRGDRFGFHEPDHLVPPGSEPDLRALNNPYVAEQVAKECQSTTSEIEGSVSASSGVSALAHRLPHLSCNNRSSSSLTASRSYAPAATVDHIRSTFEQNLDPTLKAPTAFRKAEHNNGDSSEDESADEDRSWKGYHGGCEDNLSDKASAESSDDELAHRRRQATGFRAETQSSQVVRHTSMPPEDAFEYSRDEADENAAALLRTPDEAPDNQTVDVLDQAPNGQTVDVLDHHQQKNGHPRAPDPAMLTLYREQSMALVDGDASNPTPLHEQRAPRHSRRARDLPVPPNHIGHYGPVWKDCLEEAKIECRAVHALSNPWPKLKMDVDTLTESLTTVVMQWTQRGCWPEKKTAMVRMLYEDMSTWRSEMKKAAIGSAPLLYQLEPAPGVKCPDHIAFVQDAAAALLQQSLFLRHGVDENGKTRNFAHPALKDVIIKFFYTGSYRIAHQHPDIFRSRIPNSCLAAVCAAFNCVLDGYAKNGTGKWFPKFSAKAYASIYNAILALIEETSRNPYHGPRCHAPKVFGDVSMDSEAE
ncbi:hypothetical protein EDD15DRAFT_2366042 [Pisolithus albus]|nr:hypothetical protein EDD15DRAFT_2366042 [Pisolithus albus]